MSISLKVLCLLLLLGSLSGGFAISQTSSSSQNSKPAAAPTTTQESTKVADHKSDPVEQAWEILRTGAKSEKIEERTTAIRVLSLLRGQTAAIALARHALDDDKAEVRRAAAGALGELRARSTIPELNNALSDKEVSVVLAAAHALVQMKDAEGYDVYYAILTGERKGSPGLISSQLATLKDAKKMALLGFQEGIGFVPFAGIGYTAIKTILKDDSSPVRAAAAKMLTQDPDPKTGEALADRVSDDNELVRTAALEALAERDDPAFIARITSAMFDKKELVKYTAAASVVRLSAIAERRKRTAKKP
jgi:HEAT repeat protein